MCGALSQAGWLVWLAGFSLLCGLGGWLWIRQLQRHTEQLLGDAPPVTPNQHWSKQAQAAWAKVENIVADINPQDYAVTDQAALVTLGKQAMETVAQHYHPKAKQPLLETPIP